MRQSLSDGTRSEMVWQQHFGPFVPLIVPWMEMSIFYQHGNAEWKQQWPNSLCAMLQTLFTNLDPRFLYMTVNQHDQGIFQIVEMTSTEEQCGHSFQNRYLTEWENQILQLNAGGYGHVPIPLAHPFKKTVEELTLPRNNLLDSNILGSVLTWKDTTPKHNAFLLGFSGRLWDIRTSLHSAMTQIKPAKNEQQLYVRYRGDLWELFAWGCCKFMVTPRGRGPTSFSIYETLELASIQGSGALPIYVWSGIKWLPYRPLWDEFITTVEWKPVCNETIADIIQTATDLLNSSEYEQRMKWIEQNFQKYFGFEGMSKQIQWLLVDGPHDAAGGSRSSLHCEGKPNITVEKQHEVYCK